MLLYVWVYVLWPCNVWVKKVSSDPIPKTSSEDNVKFFEDMLGSFGPKSGGPEEETINDTPSSVDATATSKGYLGWGIRTSFALYIESKFRKMLGLFSFDEITRDFTNMSVNKIKYKEAAQIGAFKSFNITLKAVDTNNMYPLFGKVHKTYIMCSSDTSKDSIISYLSSNKIKVGEDNFLYEADLNSFRWRRVNTKV